MFFRSAPITALNRSFRAFFGRTKILTVSIDQPSGFHNSYCIFALPDRLNPQPDHCSGGGGRIRTYVGISQQIYSLPSLAA